ncbi:hypothetical protein LZ32DRAFT_91099 [Colletotrichum eremochloae]|nr:hypothetical protein LZ32DRAFT_91099 [Colletotrichum eremochloae]
MSWGFALERAAVAICCTLFGFVVSTFLTLSQNQRPPSEDGVFGTIHPQTFQFLYLVQNILPLLPVLALFCIGHGPWAIALATYMNLGEHLHIAILWRPPYLPMKIAATVVGSSALLTCSLVGVGLTRKGQSVLGSLLLGIPGMVLAGFCCFQSVTLRRKKLVEQRNHWFRWISLVYGAQVVLLAASTLMCIFVADTGQIFYFATLPAKLAWAYCGLQSMLRARQAGRRNEAKTNQPSQETLCTRISQSGPRPSEEISGSFRATLPIDRQRC